MTQWTTAQQKAIDSRDCNLLVSAAAGSGKTAVLVERIVNRVADEGVDIDRILVVTFTKAAAAQMKQRIGDAIEERLSRDPDNAHLQRQSALVHHAPISTIDSFCLDVVRSHIHDTKLDPDFRIADEGELRLLEHDVFIRLKEQAYAEEDPGFLHLVDSIEPQLREENLENCVLSLYHFSQAYPWPDRWRREALAPYQIRSEEDLEAAEWVRYVVRYITGQTADAVFKLRSCAAEGGDLSASDSKGYAAKLAVEAAGLEDIAGARTYSALYERTRSLPWGRLVKSKTDDPELFEKAKTVRNECKDRVNALIGRYVQFSPEQVTAITEQSGKCAKTLVEFTERFERELTEAKRDRGIADFSDIEHMALQVLLQLLPDGSAQPTDAARQYAENFAEVMIDEYQDSNEVQELLLKAVSGEWNDRTPNRFMVGDVKQSIYRFRQAMPELFMEKHHTYGTEGEAPYRKIELNANFRSRPRLLEGINMIFAQIMRPELGGVAYDEDAALHPGASFPELPESSLPECEMWLVDKEDGEEAGEETEQADQTSEEGTSTSAPADDEEMTDSDIREAWITARRIISLMEKEKVWDARQGVFRPMRYSDIAVLLRATKGHADAWVQVFEQAGIPAYTGSGTGYFSAPEVRLVLACLHVLDNPRQDIPLTAVLRSPIGGFSAEEIAGIRLSGGRGQTVWDDLQTFEGEPALTEKVHAFLDQTEKLRREAALLPIHELIWRLVTGTGYLDYVTAMPAGAQRRANLNMLSERAAEFEKGSYRGLFHFLRYIQTLQSYQIDYGEAPLSGENADTVLIMSIHKSKGLEFPVTFVCGMGRRFNTREASGDLILNQKFGMGLQTVDPDRHVRLPSPVCGALALRSLEEAKGEELRVLYVAATRAKERLILIGSAALPKGKDEEKDKKSQLHQWYRIAAGEQEEQFGTVTLDAAKCPFDLLVSAALRHPEAAPFLEEYGFEPISSRHAAASGAGFALHAVTPYSSDMLLGDSAEDTAEDHAEHLFAIRPGEVYDSRIAEDFERISKAVYAHEHLAGIRAKVSVSYLKAGAYEEEQERIYQLISDRDENEGGQTETADTDHARNTRLMGAAARGNLYHSFMEHLDFTASAAADLLFDQQLETLIKCGKMPDDARKILRKQDFVQFFRSDLFTRMKGAAVRGTLHKEAPFVLGEQARDLKEEWDSEELVLVQGIIDAWFRDEDGQIVLLDYKTDAVPDGDEESLVRKYRTQLTLYAGALERLTGCGVKEQLIWSFALGKAVDVR